MAKKETPENLLNKYLGKAAAKALLDKIDKMIAKGDSAAKIENAVRIEIAASIEKQISKAVSAVIGPGIKIQPEVSNMISKRREENKIGPRGKIGPKIQPKIQPKTQPKTQPRPQNVTRKIGP